MNLSLLAGSLLIAVPIILHLIMRKKPVRLEFPALRFIQTRHDANRRRLQLRHLLLLLLRAAIIALLAFALARPSVKLGGALGSQEEPVAAALVFDAAPRMEYRHLNHTRLDAARDFGLWLVRQLPEQSDIAVLDTRLGSPAAFQADRGAARERISRLDSVANSQPLPTVIDAAVKLLADREKKNPDSPRRKEIYIFTDLSRGAWPPDDAAAVQKALASLGDCGLYVIDVGIQEPTDYGLSEAHLGAEVLSNRSTLTIETAVSCIGPAAAKTVELYLLDADRKPQKRDEQTCQATPVELRPIEFHVGNLDPGTHQGYLRIVGQDGLAADDTRYFTVEVKPAWRLLLAAPKPADSYALFLAEALAPDIFRKRGQARFDCDVCDLSELAKRPLAEYAAVCVLDPTPIEPATWRRLVDFASEGHGVAVFLGRNALPMDSFNASEAQELLPGKLLRQARRPEGDLWLNPRDFQHPILTPFRSQAGSIPWEMFPVFRYWEFEKLTKGVSVVLPYSDGRPALLERPIGQGRALVMTTPVSDRPGQNPWNLLPVGEAWPFMILANQMASYLVGSSSQQLNYMAGQTAVLQLDAAARRRGYMLFTPDGQATPYAADLSRRELPISTTDTVGNYRLQAAGGAGGASLGFSVNYATAETQLDRLTDRELSAVFGPQKFRLARTKQQIDRDVSLGRTGRELYPPLILLIAVILGLELLVANRFYKE
ncbi:MAG: BatA domain-containing protein [Thermoguttaceae bacterium]